MSKFKLAILASHPIQYHIPLFKLLANHPDLDLMVYFCRDAGLKKEYDPGFDKEIQWDVPLLEGYRYKFLKNYSLKSSYSFFGQINPEIIKKLFKNRYDAILIHGYAFFTNWLAWLGALLTRTPVLLRGESHLLSYRSNLKLLVKNILLRPFFKTISAFLAIGTLNKNYYLYYGVPEEKIFLVPYTVDENFFKKKAERLSEHRNKMREELGIKDDEILFLYVGKIYGAKGPGALDLLKAFEKLGKNPKAWLIFVGEGKEKVILENYVKEHQIGKVIFTGFKNQTEIPRYYAVADVFVLPSYSEQWGIVLNESMYFGNAVIASDRVGAAYDLVDEGKNGFIFPAGRIKELSKCLKLLTDDKRLLESMKQESKRIIEDWGLGRCIDGFISTLNYTKKRI